MKQIDEELRVTGALAKHPESSRTLEIPSLEAAEARPAFAPPSADHAGVIEVGTFGSRVEEERIASAAAAVREAAPSLGSSRSPPTDWDDVRLRVDPRFRRAEPPRRRSWPWVVLIALAAAAVAVFVVLPRYAQNGGDISLPDVVKNAQAIVAKATADAKSAVSSSSSSGNTAVESSTQTAQTSVPSGGGVVSGLGAAQRVPDLSAPPSESASLPSGASTSAGTDSSGSGPAGDPLAKARDTFTQRLAALDARGAGVWGGPDFAAAKTRAAEAVGASDAGSPRIAEQRLNEALRLLGNVELRSSQTLAQQLTAGDRALAAGQGEVAKQAYESARRIDPGNRRASDGLQRTRNLGGVLPLIADGENAEGAKDYARAVQDYSQALSLDPNNIKARAGLDRAHAAFGQDSYAKAIGSGFAALGAGRLDEARIAFEKARTIRPAGPEAATGLSRVGAALSARGFASTRQRGAGLEGEERWTDAFNEYDAALKVDPSLVFAQQGRARTADRAELSNSLQGLIDRPERLAAPAVRDEADALLKRATIAQPSGPVLRSQIARLQILLPEFDVPVRLELVSDNATLVQIQRVGAFGSFDRRQIELKPGKYTVVGTRPGFRDVRRDVTIAPGRDVQTISVSCVEPI
jgi:tetratricopeptide (TPR) repeat protein